MKKENIDRVNDIVNMIDSKQKDIASLRLASFASITRLNGNAFIEVSLDPLRHGNNYHDLAIAFRDGIIERMTSDISDLEDELETL